MDKYFNFLGTHESLILLMWQSMSYFVLYKYTIMPTMYNHKLLFTLKCFKTLGEPQPTSTFFPTSKADVIHSKEKAITLRGSTSGGFFNTKTFVRKSST